MIINSEISYSWETINGKFNDLRKVNMVINSIKCNECNKVFKSYHDMIYSNKLSSCPHCDLLEINFYQIKRD